METITKDGCKVAIFKAPEGEPRKIMKDYMLRMSAIEWTPKEDFTVTWKGEAKYRVNLEYKKGNVYHGVPYANTKANLDEFEQQLENGVFDPVSPYYEEIVGNHCSSSIVRAVQVLYDPGPGYTFKPNLYHGRLVQFPLPMRKKSNHSFKEDHFDSYDLWDWNAKNDIMDAYATLDEGDFMFYATNRSAGGHIRMVGKKSLVIRDPYTGLIDPENSYAYSIEQTNAWDKERPEDRSTWFLYHKYSFAKLYEKHFMPATLPIYYSGEKLKDAYVFYDGDNSSKEKIFEGIKGRVKGTFPLVYVSAVVRDENGHAVRRSSVRNMFQVYEVDLADLNKDLGLDTLEKGKYNFSLRASVARGGVNFESFDFEV